LFFFFCFLLTEKLNHVAKALYLSSQNTVDCYKLFCSVSKFLITNTIFFSSWNICSIIPLIFITYLALVHNYNTIKCICFINSRQRAGKSSRIWLEHVVFNITSNSFNINHQLKDQGFTVSFFIKRIVL